MTKCDKGVVVVAVVVNGALRALFSFVSMHSSALRARGHYRAHGARSFGGTSEAGTK